MGKENKATLTALQKLEAYAKEIDLGDEETEKLNTLLAAAAEEAAPEPEVVAAPVDTEAISAMVASKIDEGLTAMRSEFTEMIDEVVSEIVDAVSAKVDERMSTLEAAVEEIKTAKAGTLRGFKPVDGTTDPDEVETALSAEEMDKMRDDPQLAPRLLRKALDGYSSRHGDYIPFDAPAVNVAPEHLQSLQNVRLPGESFRFATPGMHR
jgi:hypothetical protein